MSYVHIRLFKLDVSKKIGGDGGSTPGPGIRENKNYWASVKRSFCLSLFAGTLYIRRWRIIFWIKQLLSSEK